MRKRFTLFLFVLHLLFIVLVYFEYQAISIQPQLVSFYTWACFFGFFVTTFFFLLHLLIGLIGMRKHKRQIIWVAAFSITFFLIAFELILRINGHHASYTEHGLKGNYASPYVTQEQGWLHIWGKNEEHSANNGPDRPVLTRKTNSLGLTGPDPAIEKDSNAYRIIAFGDSFTEGWGTTEDSSWVNVFKGLVDDEIPDKQVEAINAGVAGSDPLFGYIFLKTEMLNYNPDLVLVTINYSDEGDVMLRGGLERFLPDGTTQYTDAPKWERLYAVSYSFRWLIRKMVAMDDLLIPDAEREQRREKAIEDLDEGLQALEVLSEQSNIPIALVFHPMFNEIFMLEYESDFQRLIDEFRSRNKVIVVDAMPHFRDSLGLTEETVYGYYLDGDYHHNGKGYRELAKAIFNSLKEEDIWEQTTSVNSDSTQIAL